MRLALVLLLGALVFMPPSVSADTTVGPYTSTADFDGGTKSVPTPTDGVFETETVTDNPQVASGALTLGRIGGDTFATADSNAETWRWRPIFIDTEGCSGLGTGTNSISSGAMHISITRSGLSTAWTYVRSAYRLEGDFDLDVLITSTSPGSDFSEIIDLQFFDGPNGCYFNTPAMSGVLYRLTRTSGTNLQASAWTVTDGTATQIGANTNLNVVAACIRVVRAANVFTWYYDTTGACTAFTQDETTTFDPSSTGLYPILAVSDQVGTTNAASFDADNFRVTTGTVSAIGSRITGTDSTYEGTSDYDAQIFTNSRGEMVYITGVSPTSDTRIHVRYSTTGGQTWSNRIILFSNDGQGDGIIDADMGGMWEFSGQVVADVLYLVMHLCPPGPGAGSCSRNAFTKVDISDIRNVETFSNWQSADGDRVPSLGGGSDGNGYDIISDVGYIDPSIAVLSASDIWVTVIRNAVPLDIVYIVRWNGATWSSPTAIYDDAGNLAVGLARIRNINDGDLVVAFIKTQGDAFNPAIAQRCDKGGGADCTSSANWHGFDGAGTFDYVIDTGAGAFHWPIIYQDASNRVHVIAVSAYLISGFSRAFHNYWTGAAWANAETENAAGTRIDVTIAATSEPRVANDARAMHFNVDGAGNVLMFLNAANGPDGAGLYSFKWDGSWTAANYVFRSFGVGAIVGSGNMAGHEVIAPFLISNGQDDMQVAFSPGAVAGDPWWDNQDATSVHAFRTRGSWTTPTTFVSNQQVTEITLTHSGLSATAYIDRIEVLDDGVAIWTYETDITGGASSLLAPNRQVDGLISTRVTLASSTTSASPVLESLSYLLVPRTLTFFETNAFGWVLFVVLLAVGSAGRPSLRVFLILAGMILLFLSLTTFGSSNVAFMVIGMGASLLFILIGAFSILYGEGESA